MKFKYQHGYCHLHDRVLLFNKSQHPGNQSSSIINTSLSYTPILVEFGILVVVSAVLYYLEASVIMYFVVGLYSIGRMVYDFVWKRNQMRIKRIAIENIKSVTYNIDESKTFGYFKVVYNPSKNKHKTKVIEMQPFLDRPKHEIEAAKALFDSIGY